MQALFESVYDILHSAWRFRWWALLASAITAIVCWAVVFALPDRYEASARVFVDTRTALRPVLQGLTMEQDVNAQLNLVRQSLLAGPQLEKIAIESGVLSAAVTNPAAKAEVMRDMAQRVQLTVTS